MHRGYVKLWRKTLDNGVLQNGDLCRFWMYCLLKASHKDHKAIIGYQEIELHSGEFVFGRKKASHELRMTESKVRKSLHTLEKMKNVTIKTTNKFSIVSIVNWSIYQQEEIANDQQTNQQTTINQPTNDQQTTTYKNVKNVKNGRMVRSKTSTMSYDEEFERFWLSYPAHRRTNKKEAYRVWKGMNGDRPPIEVVMLSLEEWSVSEDWGKEDGKFVPGAMKFIEGRYWEAEPRKRGRYSEVTRRNVIAAMEVAKERGLQ